MNFFTTRLLKVKNGMDREQGKAVLISTHTPTHKPNVLLHNSPTKVENGFGREQGKAVLISTHT